MSMLRHHGRPAGVLQHRPSPGRGFVFTLLLLLAAASGGCGSSGGSSPPSAASARLAALVPSTGALDPGFSPTTFFYSASAGFLTPSIALTPTPEDPAATVTVNGFLTASGASSPPVFLDAGPTPVLILVTAADGSSQLTYTVLFTRHTLAQTAYVKSSNTGAEDTSASAGEDPTHQLAVALSGDTLAIGVPGEDSDATGVNGDQASNDAMESGAVYVFFRTGGLWAQEAYLKASNAEALDEFGFALALSGDTLVVGAPLEDSNATGVDGDQASNDAVESGAAYVFVRTGGVWAQEAYLKASNTGVSDRFGFAVSVAGDRLVVGAPGESSSATGVNGDEANDLAGNSGAAYVFLRTGGVWAQEAYLKASNTGASDGFGSALSLSGATLVAGAPFEDSNATGVGGQESDNSATNSGAAYVFSETAGAWAQHAYLKASNTGAADQFGAAVGVSLERLVVGAPGESSDAVGVDGDGDNDLSASSGAAYVFFRGGGTWIEEAYLKASNTQAVSHFGAAVSLSGDSLVVGAPGESSDATGIDGDQTSTGASGSGAAYVFLLADEAWDQEVYVKASNTGAVDRFGASVSLSGDTLVVGAPGESSNATGVNGDETNNDAEKSGAAYVLQ